MRSAKLFGLVLVFLGLAACNTGVGFAETGTFDRTLRVSAPVDLGIVTGSGNIKVHAGGDGNVYVHARIHARDSTFGMSASEKIRKLQANPPIEQDGNSIHIGRIDDHDLRQNVSVDYDLTVPAQTKITSQAGSGNQNVEGVQLAVNAQAGSGNITVENTGAEVHAQSGSGDQKITSVKGALEAEAGSGNIRARDIAGSISATTGSGDITVDGNPTSDWRVRAGSGDIDLKIPPGTSFNIDARTSSGSLKVNHQVTAQGTSSRNHLQGKVGNGGVLVDLHTGSGDIQVD